MRPVILLYHRIGSSSPDPWGLSVTAEHFAEHLEVLHRNACPVRLDEALAADARPGSVVVTFDDGYADNLKAAHPLLERFDVPAVVFVTTRCLDRDAFWWDELCELVLENPDDAADTSWRAWNDHGTPAQARFRSTWESLRTLSERERGQALDSMRRALSPGPRVQQPDSRPLTRNELAALSQCSLVELGCHTQTHPVLSALDPASQRCEIAGSRADLEQLTGRTPTAFAYPYGHRCDYSDATIALVREAGFATACTTDPDPLDRGVDRFQLARIHVEDCDGDEFSRRLSRWLDLHR